MSELPGIIERGELVGHPAENGDDVGDVAFQLTTDGLWRAAGRAPSADFVILVSSVRAAIEAAGPGEITASVGGSAAASATTSDAAMRMLARLVAEGDPERLGRTELSVPDRLPFEAVNLISVPNEKVRNAVRRMYRPSGPAPKVAVYPPWFQQPEGGPTVS